MDRDGAALLGRPGDFRPIDPDFVDVEFQAPAAPAPGALPDVSAPDELAPAGSAPGAPDLDGPVPVAVGLPGPPARIPGNINGLGEREIEEALLDREGGEVAFGGGLFVWQGDQLFRREPDGTLSPTGSLLSPNDTSLDDEGLEWLRQSDDGGALIQVTLRVWATINFEYNSDAILPDSEDVLETFGQALNRPALRDKRLIISGHADSTGPADFNLGLSRRRAASVGRWLAEKGHLSPDRLILAGYGASMPVADNGTEEGRALNRRVEFILVN
jgi:outer membrane protein OmpA-like peptidoglycan-associated protein